MAIIKIKKYIGKTRIKFLGIRIFFRHNYRKRTALNYERKRKELRERFGKKKITVGFLVRENSKWSYESLYRRLEASQNYRPLILIADGWEGLSSIDDNVLFFRKYRHCIIKNKKDYVRQRVDILFYEQPWYDMDGEFSPDRMSACSLTFYVPYGIETGKNEEVMQKTEEFYHAIYKTFTFNQADSDALARFGVHNTCVAGHPRLDAYREAGEQECPWKTTGKTRIIYAPHHSFADSLIRQGTWEWNGDYLLQLAKKHQDTTEWILKPHPRFWHELGRLLKSEQKAEQIKEEWARVSHTYDCGNYYGLFKTADLMISDCVSFKIEWLPTLKPYIQLNTHYKDACTFEGEDYYAEHYYHADTTEDINRWFDLLVNKHEDPKREARQARAAEVPLGATERIIEFIDSELQ